MESQSTEGNFTIDISPQYFTLDGFIQPALRAFTIEESVGQSIEQFSHTSDVTYTSNLGRLGNETESTTHGHIKLVCNNYGTGPSAIIYIHGWTCSRALWNQSC
jgi:hypothetical protein